MTPAQFSVTELELQGLYLVQLAVHGDSRGFFVERFQEKRFAEHGLPTRFVQDNHSRSAPGVLRGLHYQTAPAQGKLVGVTRGAILDVVVDIRSNSETFGKHAAVELSDMNGRLLWVPPGFAHGFCVLGSEPADVFYKVDSFYEPKTEGGIYPLDSALKIAWPISAPQLSARDSKLTSWTEYSQNPHF
ncbi:MAG: dTDP-4-dehydrorhamnose 3,5-epimerase [Bdellovibrionales bacterium]|nr:dTDP-4-dehydrorhamnose 3,5-epimerase [Bdellovibrionales bacterium]